MHPSWHCDPWNITLCYPYYYWWYYPYYWWYDPYYYSYYSTTTQKPKTFELKVETNPSGIAPVNGAGTYNQGTSATFSLTSLIVPVTADERYVFTYWSGAFSGGAPSGAVTMDSSKTVIANYQVEYHLKVSTDPPGIAAATGSGWYRPGQTVMVSGVPVSVSGGDGVRYMFEHWTTDGVSVSGSTVEVTTDAPHKVIAHYKTQYLLTVESAYGHIQGDGWHDAGSTATFSVTTPVEVSFGVNEVFERWIGDVDSTSTSATVTMNAPHTVTAVWRTDSTILYATIAIGIGGAFALGLVLALLVIPRISRARWMRPPSPPPKPSASAETAPEKVKPPPTKKKVKPQPAEATSSESAT